MPTYYFKNKKTNETYSDFMSINDLDEYLKNPDIEQIITAPAIMSGRGMSKPDESFRDILRNIKDKHSRGITKSTVNTFD